MVYLGSPFPALSSVTRSFRYTEQFHSVTPAHAGVPSSALASIFSHNGQGCVWTELFQSLIPLPLPSTMTHIFLLGSWDQEGKLPGLPPHFFSPLGVILRSPQGR
jgi:hypothetical protein